MNNPDNGVFITKSKAGGVVTFLGLVLVLIGLYASLRTAINFLAFEKYPPAGVLTVNFSGYTSYQSERDCYSTQSYSTPDGKSRPATVEEKDNEKKQQDYCLESVKEARNSAKVTDIGQSISFLIIGLGVFLAKKLFF